MNHRFNIAQWLPRFPLEDRNAWYSPEIITSPWHICQNEHLRREMQDYFDWGRPVPMDVFVMADGEPVDRHVTKIGGLPYRPASAAWPRLPGRVPLVFLAQVNFRDSKDLTRDLPGDVLLIFADNPWAQAFLHFEWQPIGLPEVVQADGVPEPLDDTDLDTLWNDLEEHGPIQQALERMGIELPDELPNPTGTIAPCYGHVCRTASFPDAVPRDPEAGQATCHGKPVSQEWALLCYQATQIGEAPFFIQEIAYRELPGRMLCTINSVQPAFDRPYPWLNRPEPLPLGTKSADDYLTIGDMGCIYVSIDKRGKLHWSQTCY